MKEHEKLLPNFMQLKFLERSIEKNTKYFSIKDLLLQMYRMVHIRFIIEIKFILFQLIYIPFIYKILSMLFDSDMVKVQTCLTNEQFYLNSSAKCSDILDDESYLQYYRFFQLFILDFHLLGIACFSAMSLLFILKIFQNEHWNSEFISN